jgi:hypothetical protein
MTALSHPLHTSGLQALDAALDTDVMSRRLAPFLDEGSDSRVVAARLVASVRGKRAVVAYETIGKHGAGIALIGKVFADRERARRLHVVLGQLRALALTGKACEAPRPIALLPELGMAVHAAVYGRSLDRLAGAERLDGMIAAALWLSNLHSSGITLERRFDTASELRKLSAWAEVVTRHHPPAAAPTARLLLHLSSLAARIEIASGVPVHEDFHYQHVLVDGGRVVVIDFDEMRAGDPAFDVAHFGANLRLLAIREVMPSDEAARLDAAFLDGYVSRTGYEPGLRHDFFHAYTCLKIAKQLVRGRGPAPVPTGAELGRQLDLIIEEGVSCPRR